MILHIVRFPLEKLHKLDFEDLLESRRFPGGVRDDKLVWTGSQNRLGKGRLWQMHWKH